MSWAHSFRAPVRWCDCGAILWLGALDFLLFFHASLVRSSVFFLRHERPLPLKRLAF